MATQDVHFSITQPDITTGTVGWTGTLLAVPVGTSGHPVVHLDGVDLVVPEPISITITSGEATVAMEITGTTWVWMVRSVDSDSNPMLPARFVSVAASASTVEFADLPQIDLATLSPTANPTAAWDAALAALQAEVDALGGPVADASTTAKGIVELATDTETTTGTDTARATTPAGVAAAIAAAIATVATALAARVRTDTAAQGLDSTQQANARTNIGAAAAAELASYQPAGSYVTSAEVASFAVWCYWDGDSWQTLAGSAVPTSTALVRIYDSTQYDTAGVTAPTHYNALDKWWQKAA